MCESGDFRSADASGSFAAIPETSSGIAPRRLPQRHHICLPVIVNSCTSLMGNQVRAGRQPQHRKDAGIECTQ
jgi:hypothetical protein